MSARRRPTALVLLLLMGWLGTLSAVAVPPVVAQAAPVTSLAEDLSDRLPATTRSEAFGDMLDRGYDQRAVVEGDRLNIYEPPAKGGGLITSTESELQPPTPNDKDSIWNTTDKTRDSAEGLELRQAYLAFVDNGGGGRNELIIAGRKPGNRDTAWFRVPSNGTCAKAACANSIGNLPKVWSEGAYIRFVVVTSLAVDRSGTMVAVGLSDFGVKIFRLSDGAELDTFGGCGINQSPRPQTPVTAVAFGPQNAMTGDRTLAVACLTKGDIGYMATVKSTGKIDSYRVWKNSSGDNLLPTAISAAVGRFTNNQEVVAFGMSGGDVAIVDPRATSGTPLAKSPPPPDGGMVSGLAFVNRTDAGPASAQDLAVAQAKDFGSQVLRFDGSQTLKPLALGPDGDTTVDIDGLRNWFPGYKLGRFSVANNAAQPLQLNLTSSPDGGYGCWFAPAVPGGKLFPSATVNLPASTTQPTSGAFTLGGFTAGGGGDCAPTDDPSSQWAAYLTVTPTTHPADRLVVKLELNRATGELELDQVGGSLSVRVERTADGPGLGTWRLTVDGYVGATAYSAGKVTVTSLPKLLASPRPTVYKFNVEGVTFAMPPRLQDQVPAIGIEGSVDGATYTKLGDLVPRTAPTLLPGTDGSLYLFLGRATFWWENASGEPAYRYFRTRVGTLTAARADTGLAKPLTLVPNGGVQVVPTGTDTTARPYANGLDQAQLSVAVQNAAGAPLPVTSPAYGQVYYRDKLRRLITNLYVTGDPAEFIGVSPFAGQYSKATSGRPGTSNYNWVSTTNTNDQKIVAYVAGGVDDTGVPDPSADIDVFGADLLPDVSQRSSAAAGITLEGCTDFAGGDTCRLAVPLPKRPIMYQVAAGDVPRIGILTDALAVTSTQSLPLKQDGTSERQLAAPELLFDERKAYLSDVSMFGDGDLIDTTLATHGTLVTLTGIPVG